MSRKGISVVPVYLWLVSLSIWALISWPFALRLLRSPVTLPIAEALGAGKSQLIRCGGLPWGWVPSVW